MEFITVTRSDPEFEPYLMGTFSTTHRALPVETFHPQTARERITFRLVPIEKVAVPSWWVVYFWACRPELLGLTLGPSVAAWLNGRAHLSEWTKWPSWLALAGIFFLHTGVFLLNDVQDHLRGSDRFNRRRGSQVIQKGWVSAARLKTWAWFNLALSIVFGVPAVLNAPVRLLEVCLLASLCLYVILKNLGVRWGLVDVALILLFGPLLTCGIALASFGNCSLGDIWLGLAFGCLTEWVFQARQFGHMFRSHAERFRTFLGFHAFDRARMIFVVEGAVVLAVLLCVALRLGVQLSFFAPLPLMSIPMALFSVRMGRAASPLSSNLLNSERWALSSHLLLLSWWIFVLGVPWL